MGRTKGATNYTAEEIDTLLEMVEEVVPVGKAGWETVQARYALFAKRAGWVERDVEALRNKFRGLQETRDYDGAPDYVRRAKTMQHTLDRAPFTEPGVAAEASHDPGSGRPGGGGCGGGDAFRGHLRGADRGGE